MRVWIAKPVIVTKVKVRFRQAVRTIVAYLPTAVAAIEGFCAIWLASVGKTPTWYRARLTFFNCRFALGYFWAGAAGVSEAYLMVSETAFAATYAVAAAAAPHVTTSRPGTSTVTPHAASASSPIEPINGSEKKPVGSLNRAGRPLCTSYRTCPAEPHTGHLALPVPFEPMIETF